MRGGGNGIGHADARRGRGGGMRRARGARELAVLPEGEDGFQAGDQAGKGGQNQGVQGRDQPGAGLVMGRLGINAGQNGGKLLGHRR